MIAASTALDTEASFATPEHIAFRFRAAGPTVRFCAWLIDVLLRGVVLVALAIPALFLGLKFAVGLWLVLWFLVDWLLGGLIEWRWEGFTPGKKLCGIRVIGSDGLPAGAGACFLRNVLRFADSLPTLMTGLIAMVVSGRFQRLGDLAAGTLVVYDEGAGQARPVKLADKRIAALAESLPAEVQVAVDGAALRAIVAYVTRREQLHPGRRAEVAKPLAGALARRLDLSPPTEPDLLLCAVYHALTARGGEGSDAGQVGARAAAYLGRRQGSWKEVEAALAGKPQRVIGRDEPPPVRFASLYRSSCADLALAEAYHLPEGTVRYLDRLVARTHLRFYRRLAIDWRRLAHQVLVEVPGRLYGDGCLRTALITFFGTFLLAGLLGMANPESAVAFIGQETADSMREMYAEPPNRRSADEGGAMYGFYIHNNVGIALACFASGIFAGIGALLWLAANGVFLGFVFGYMGTVDPATRSHFFEFVLAHGPFELTGIALAGAAGLRLGLGLVRTGGLPRLESLMASARESVPMIAVAAMLVASAAPIEAFVSPSALPHAAKAAMAVICATIIAVYLVGLGRRAQRQQPPQLQPQVQKQQAGA